MLANIQLAFISKPDHATVLTGDKKTIDHLHVFTCNLKEKFQILLFYTKNGEKYEKIGNNYS